MVLLGALCAVGGAAVTGSSINAYGIDCSVLAPLYCTVSVLVYASVYSSIHAYGFAAVCLLLCTAR
jgi:hypothetical protein